MKKIFICLMAVVVSLSLYSVTFADGANNAFTDVDSSTQIGQDIYKLFEAGIINGNGDGTFAPQNPVTRAQLCKMINNICGYTAVSSDGFSDVTPDKWYYTHVLIGKQAGYINGFPDGTFHGDDPVTREQTCAIVCRAMGIYDLGIEVQINDPISDWALPYVKALVGNRLITLEAGNTFRATENMKRGELSGTLSKFVSTGSGSVVTPSTGGGSFGGGNNNTGNNNTGNNNTGNNNTGNNNTGNNNTGNNNTGNNNTGNNNTDNNNTDNNNTGNNNTGNNNTGNNNTGNNNTGNNNTGNDTPGSNTPGNDTPGNNNTGNDNTGNDNTGNDNTGNNNTGNDNTGSDEPEEEEIDNTEIAAKLLSIKNDIATKAKVGLGATIKGELATWLRELNQSVIGPCYTTATNNEVAVTDAYIRKTYKSEISIFRTRYNSVDAVTLAEYEEIIRDNITEFWFFVEFFGIDLD